MVNIVDAKEEIVNNKYDEKNEYLLGYSISQLKDPLQVGIILMNNFVISFG